MNTSIEIRHLRHFIALAEELHFGRAAKRCHISQPPFSVSIRQLEEGLDLSLVERNTHEVRLTSAGRTYYEEALKIVSQLARAQAAARNVSEGLAGSLDVGFFASMLYRGLDRIVDTFKKDHPDVALRLIELSTADQVPALQRHKIQYGFIHGIDSPEGVESEEVLREPFVLCVPSTHRMASREHVSIAEVSGEPFVLFSRNFSPIYFDQVISICVSAGFHPEIVHEARHWLTVLALVSKGLGITLVPRGLASYGLPTLRFIEMETTSVQSFVRGAWLASTHEEASIRAWHDTVKKVLRTAA